MTLWAVVREMEAGGFSWREGEAAACLKEVGKRAPGLTGHMVSPAHLRLHVLDACVARRTPPLPSALARCRCASRTSWSARTCPPRGLVKAGSCCSVACESGWWVLPPLDYCTHGYKRYRKGTQHDCPAFHHHLQQHFVELSSPR